MMQLHPIMCRCSECRQLWGRFERSWKPQCGHNWINPNCQSKESCRIQEVCVMAVEIRNVLNGTAEDRSA
jgi:hypothetical protein